MLTSTGILLFATAFGIAALVLPLLERRALRLGMTDRPGGRKNHPHPTPLTGGIGILLAVAVPAVGGLLIALVGDTAGQLLPEELARHLPGIRSRAGELLVILFGAGVLMLVGHVDDRRGLSPWLRLAVQVGCALAVVGIGVRATLFLPGVIVPGALTVLFIVFVTNAVNFVDNTNGLCAGVVLIGSLHLLALAVETEQLFMAGILVCLAGGLVAFLPRNFPRATSFLGDAGSTALGFLLAALTVAFTFDESGTANARPVLLPLLVLAVPVADGLTVIVSRVRRGVHPFTAGRDHLSHRIMDRGVSATRTVSLLWAIQALSGVPLLLLGSVTPEVALAAWSPAIALLVLLALRGYRIRSETGS